MKTLKKLALGFSVYVFLPIFFSVNLVISFLIVALFTVSFFDYGYDKAVFIYFFVFSFLLASELASFFSFRLKNLFQRLWPNILGVVARACWVVFAAIGLYDILFYDLAWNFADKTALSLDLWLLAYNLPFLVLNIFLCRKKYRNFILENWDGENNR